MTHASASSGTTLAQQALVEASKHLSLELTENSAGYVVTLRLPDDADAKRVTMRSQAGMVTLEMPKSGRSDAAPNFQGSKEVADVQRDDVVAEASDMSFPASDPPAWSAGHAGGAAQ